MIFTNAAQRHILLAVSFATYLVVFLPPLVREEVELKLI